MLGSYGTGATRPIFGIPCQVMDDLLGGTTWQNIDNALVALVYAAWGYAWIKRIKAPVVDTRD
jgi:hypothetical protein